jgi:hypothetical protein
MSNDIDVVAAVRIVSCKNKYRAEIHVKDAQFSVVIDECLTIESALRAAAQHITKVRKA